MQKWDQRFLDLAEFVSKWSKDPDAQVGAVLVSKPGGDVTVGYNGFPTGVEDSVDRLQNKDIKLELTVHAEVNAIIAAGFRARGGTLYVWGKPICARCAGPIIQSGISRVIGLNPEIDRTSKWYQTGKIAVQMLHESKITVSHYERDAQGGCREVCYLYNGGGACAASHGRTPDTR